MSQNQKMSFIGTIIWLVCALFFMYEFLLRTILGTFEHPIIQDLNLNLVTFAILSSTAYQLVYGIMQIPVGIITHRLGLKKTLFVAVFFCVLAVTGFGMSFGFDSAFVFRVLMGLGSSFGFICLLVAVYDWMPRKHIALFIGLSQFIGTMGPMLAAGPLNSLSSHAELPWRYIFYALGAIGVVIAIIVLLVVRNNTDYTGSFRILKRQERLQVNLWQLVRQRQVWYIACYSACVYFAIEYFSENSGKAFLMLHGFSSDVSSYMLTLSWLGYAIGCPLLGFISDRTSKRKRMMMFAAIICIFSVLCITYFPVNIIVISIAFFGLGIGASGQSIGFAIMAEQCNNNYLAAGLGLNNAMIMLVTSLMAPLIGGVLAHLSKGQALSITNYQHGFLLILAVIAIGVLISIFLIKETFCKSTKETTKLTVTTLKTVE